MNSHLIEGDRNNDGERPKKIIKLSMHNNEIAKTFILKAKEDVKETDGVSYAPTVMKMMAKMGYKAGHGLGASEQGITAPVEVSKQKGRRGMGAVVKSFTPSNEGWDYSQEKISVPESVEWIGADEISLSPDDLIIDIGPENLRIDNEVEFVAVETLSNILSSKSVFDELEEREMREARTRSNPYEIIKSGIFLNRAAMKMANMDSLLGFMFTSPKTLDGLPWIQNHELLYFADICAGPGGFTEYVLWRKKRLAKGFGFTLKGPCDFKLENFTVADKEYFEPHYGLGGLKGDGDIFKADNMVAFQKFVLENTYNLGVHFVMADGGFSVDGQENIQEILSKRLYLCQCLTALLILRPGGHFVCKLFDIFTRFSVSLIYIMYHAFVEISIIKPVTSRPANSERYIVCKSKLTDTAFISDHLMAVNEKLDELDRGETVTEVCSMERVFADDIFCDYVKRSNEEIGRQQIIGLAKIKHFAQNNSLIDPRQYDLRTRCLELWQVPDEPKQPTNERRELPHIAFQRLTRESRYDCQTEWLNAETIDNIKSVYDYRCIPLASDKQYFLLGLGSNQVFKYDYHDGNQRWVKIDDLNVQLPRNTLLDVEIVEEFRGEGRGQLKVNSIHVIDALFLGGDDIMKDPYEERIDKARSFVRAITRPTRTDLTTLRVKEVTHLEHIKNLFESVKMRQGKNISSTRRPTLDLEEFAVDGKPRYFVPRFLYLAHILLPPWMLAYSRSQARMYFYHTLSRQSQYEAPANAFADFKKMLNSRLVWDLTALKLCEEQLATDASGQLTVRQVVDFVESKIKL